MHRDGIGRLEFANCAYRPFDAATVMHEILWAKRKRHKMQSHGFMCVRVCVAEFDDEKRSQMHIMKCSHTTSNLWCGIICEYIRTFSAYMDARDSQRCGYWLFFFFSVLPNSIEYLVNKYLKQTKKKSNDNNIAPHACPWVNGNGRLICWMGWRVEEWLVVVVAVMRWDDVPISLNVNVNTHIGTGIRYKPFPFVRYAVTILFICAYTHTRKRTYTVQ